MTDTHSILLLLSTNLQDHILCTIDVRLKRNDHYLGILSVGAGDHSANQRYCIYREIL